MIRHFRLRYLSFVWISDLLLVNLAMLSASYLRTHIPLGASGADEVFAARPLTLALASIIWLIALNFANTYKPTHVIHLWGELRAVIVGHSLASLVFLGVLYITYRDHSRLQAVYFIGLAFFGLMSYRMALRLLYSAFHLERVVHRQIVIVGTDSNAHRIAQMIHHYGWIGLRFLGFIQLPDQPGTEANLLGTLDALPRLISQHHIDEVIISVGNDAFLSAHIMHLLHQYPVNIRLAPDYSDLAYFHIHIEDFGGVPLVGLREEVISPLQRVIKRGIDVLIATTILLIGWPIMLVIGLAIWLDSRGPVIIAQTRVGERGRLFNMYKFRSMYAGAPPRSTKSIDDPRVTRVGRFLRRTSLDELPQVINVLLGHMSLVGPRPEMTYMVDQYEPWQRKRFEVPQGMTGWWQINGRADRPMHEHTEDDLFYIQHYSLWLDLQIILRTIVVVIIGRGAY
jgi:exopolysaccharide biosynthesis polyprenyl glycosylphosphotransferase